MSKDTRYPYRLNVMRQWVDDIKDSRDKGRFYGRVVVEDVGDPEFVTIEMELAEDHARLNLMFC